MKIVADLHIHSRYARACSPELTVENLTKWGDKKGVQILATGDFTHPKWLAELGDELVEVREGLYQHKSKQYKTLFVYGTEISSIYKQDGKVRRVHNLVFAPNRETAGQINKSLEARGCNLKSDGRPITGIKCPDLVSLVKSVSQDAQIIPAHIWTPHFGVLGSLSGFDSIEDAFGEFASEIFAVETGISSDPIMNRQVTQLDHVALVSNSDPHSLRRIGREANVFEVEENDLSYRKIFEIIRSNRPEQFLYTIEFFPEEGRYHLDGHADCGFSCEPEKTQALQGVCPVCGKQLLRGVLYRVQELATRTKNEAIKGARFKSTLPLEEVLGLALGVGPLSKRVQKLYEEVVLKVPELSVLLDLSKLELVNVAGVEIANVICAVRNAEISIAPGFDGQYGKVMLSDHTLSQKSGLF